MDFDINIDSDFDTKIRHKKPKRRVSRSTLLVIMGIVLIALYGFWLFRQKKDLQGQIARIKTSIETLEKQMDETQNGDQKNNFAAPEMVLKAIDHRTEWANLILQVKAFETQDIKFESFTVSAEGKTNITGFARSLTTVKNLLKQLQDDPNVVEAFIPTIKIVDEPEPNNANVSFDLLFTFKPIES